MNYCTLLIGIRHREQVAERVQAIGEILPRLLEIQKKLLGSRPFHSLRQTRIGELRGAIELLREKAANPLPSCAFLIFTVHGAAYA
jgi:hypothetical protein